MARAVLHRERQRAHCLQLMKAIYRDMRVEELVRMELQLRAKYAKTKSPTVRVELREVEQAVRDKIWNKGGAERKKEQMRKL